MVPRFHRFDNFQTRSGG